MGPGSSGRQDLPAGRFSSWLLHIERTREEDVDVEVPCGTCTACCTSSQFVHIEPDEVETLARVPKALRVAAPGRPRGHVVMGYDERGHCPMFVDGGCSIYEDRPRTCRTYDCRVLTAAGLELDAAAATERIAERARRWRFDLSTPQERSSSEAVKAAAAFLREHADEMPGGVVPRNPTQLAFLAIQVHHVFLGPGGSVTVPTIEVVAEAISSAGRRAGPPARRRHPLPSPAPKRRG